ncbi:MAG: DUF4303 domain-containing protein [Janthinobacterium lividum]
MAIDFQALKSQLTQAAQAAFTEVLAQHRAEGIYSFALYSDEGAMTVCPATNTLAHLAIQVPEDLPYAKFEPAEWRYENVGAAAQFDAIGRQLRAQALDEARTDEAFEQFRQQLYATCVAVLDELRQQDFFNQAAGREVFLLFSVSDSDTPAAELAQLVKQLNDNAYRDEYLTWLASWEA